MFYAKLVLLLAAVTLLACPSVKSSPVNFVGSQQAEDVVTASVGCEVGNFSQFRNALANASKYRSTYDRRPCVTSRSKATVTLKCTGTYTRGNGALIQLDPVIKDWAIVTNCVNAGHQKDTMIDFAPSNFDTDRVAVMAAAGPGNTFRMKDLQFVFNGKSGAGACKDDKPCAFIRVEGFKSVSFENVGINTYNAVIFSSMPASGIHIRGADTIKLDTVKVSSVAEHGILVEEGGEVEATDPGGGRHEVTRNRAKYGGGICFQSRLADGVSGPLYQQLLLKLTGNPWLKDNKAEVCGCGMATIGNMVTERMAIAIDKGVEISGNRADKGKTWCGILPAQDDDGATSLDNFKSIWFTESQDKRRALRQILAAHPAA
ncbi:hypothetical protein OEZ86_003715 [Tetradesmus obliquus]|nr:hypothetical protein OEZ86_003715 [Tetradesmus obliquus]